MKISVYTAENDQIIVSFLNDENPNQESGFSFSGSLDDMKELNEKLSETIKEMENVKDVEVVWNPRSQRHERVEKK